MDYKLWKYQIIEELSILLASSELVNFPVFASHCNRVLGMRWAITPSKTISVRPAERLIVLAWREVR